MQLAIALNERAVDVLDVVVERTDDPAVRRLAGQIATGHRAEIGELRTLLRCSGGPETNPHEGHDMPGMATMADLAALRAASAADLIRLFSDGLRRHFAQSVLVARGQQKAGTEPATSRLAARIERSRTDQLGRIDQLAPGPGDGPAA